MEFSMQITLDAWNFEAPFGADDRYVIDYRRQIVVDVGAGCANLARFIADALNARIPQPGEGLPVTQCRSCKAPIVWAVHQETGRKAPIDAWPSFGGDIVLDGAEARWKVATALDAPGFRYRSHFATCGQADAWRRRWRG